MRDLWRQKFVTCWKEYAAAMPNADTTASQPKRMVDIYLSGKNDRNPSRFANPEVNIPEEVQRLFSTPSIAADACPLQWWKLHEKEFPVCAAMARDILAIVASSTEPERCFSRARGTIDWNQSRLGFETIQAFAILRAYLIYNDIEVPGVDYDEEKKATPLHVLDRIFAGVVLE